MKRHPHYFSNIYLHKIRGQKSQVLHELISMHFYPKQNLCSLFTKKFLVLGQDSKQHLLPNILKEETDIMEIVEPYQNTLISHSISHL